MEIKLKCSDFIYTANKISIIKNFFDFNLGSVFTDVIDVKHSKEMKAFMLLFKTAKKTNIDVARLLNQEILDSADVSDFVLTERKFTEYFEQEITITKDFFTNSIFYNPKYIHYSYEVFKSFLNSQNKGEYSCNHYLYYQTYRLNLQSEFQENRDYYKELLDYFDNPITIQNEFFDKQIEYYKKIGSFYTTPLQIEIEENKETLSDLYIEPYFDIHEHNISFEKKTNERIFIKPKAENITIHNFLINYYLANNKFNDCKEKYNMLFILGQPGQGKTSLCYRLIFDYLEQSKGLPQIPIYFVKIRDLIAKDFINRPFETINKLLNQNINFDSNECVLLLDGLDEAYMAGGLKDEDLSNLYDRLNKTSKNNQKLKIVLTSRFNYIEIDNPCIDGSLVIQIRELDNKQIQDYCNKFQQFYPSNKFVQNVNNILTVKKYEPVRELLRQAVLIYFIAISDIEIDKKDSRSKIYNKLFSTLTKRSWDKNGQLPYIKSEIRNNSTKYEKYLREYIRNIAFEIYQSPNFYITIEQIQNLDSTKNFIRKCFDKDLDSSEKIKEISKYLLISFYFQETKNSNASGTAIEFFHNSLWEYLVAEFIWEENKKILLEKDDDDDFVRLNYEEYFYSYINNIIDQKRISEEVRENLKNIIENENTEIKVNTNAQIKDLYQTAIGYDFLIEYNYKDNELTALEKTIEIFELYWIFLYHTHTSKNQYFVVDYNLGNYLFNISALGNDINYFRNTFFDEFNIDYLSHTKFEDTIFTGCYSIHEMKKCKFNETLINYMYFENSTFYDNKFTNVIFNNGSFGIHNIEKNEFSNCIFNHVNIPDEKWLDNLSKNNKVDAWIIKNHTIQKVNEFNDISKKKEIKYYINYLFEIKSDSRIEFLKKQISNQFEEDYLKEYHLNNLGL